MTPDAPEYDAFLLVSFGGPERPEDVMPFLRNVVRGRNVPDSRLEAVAAHYAHVGGKSPINDQCRALLEALRPEFRAHDIDLPLYWGNRNWGPLLPDTLAQMRDDGVQRAVAFFTSAFSSYSGCRQYLENIEAAREAVGAGAPRVDKVRGFYNHPGFVETMVERVGEALSAVRAPEPGQARLVFTAHSIPLSMARGCDYVAQLEEVCGLVARAHGHDAHDVVFQSRSGPPQVPWLEPDILDHLRTLPAQGVLDVVVVPIGFVSDHMEVVWDLDHEAHAEASKLGLRLHRAGTAGTHPRFVSMVRELVEERLGRVQTRVVRGTQPPRPDVCRPGCCAR